MYDLIIIGGGPAGLSAAVYAKRARLDVAVVEKEAFGGGQIIYSEQVDNYLGLPGKSGAELAMAFKEHADYMDIPFIESEIEGVAQGEGYFEVLCKEGEPILTRTVLIATGASHRKLGVPGEDRLIGKGVSYCATCDGAFYRDKDVVVVGGGDVALGDALYLSKFCRHVYLVHRREGLRANKTLCDRMRECDNITFMPFYEVKEIVGNDLIEKIVLINNKSGEEKALDASGIFVAVGMRANTDFVKDILELDSNGYIMTGEEGITDVPGIFAAGDVRTKILRQLVTAVSDGAVVMSSIEAYLS